ncbi:MAG: hypothetical protein AAB532_03520, partial [Patescibacteria group bacterium]
NTDPLLQAQDDPTTWEPCVEGEKPTATMTAEPTIEPVAIPTAQPTPELTREPSATIKPEILTPENGIFNQEYQEVTLNNLTKYAHRIYAPIEEDGLDLPPSKVLPETSQFHDNNLKYINKTLGYIENGGELDNTDEERNDTRRKVIYNFSLFAYTVYKECGKIEWLKLAQKAWFHGETEFGEEQFDKYAARRIKEDGGFTF